MLFSTVTADHFGYSKAEQKRWQKKHEFCGGKYQSPIAIYTNKVCILVFLNFKIIYKAKNISIDFQAVPLAMPAIEMVSYSNLLPGPLVVSNNGHSVSLTIPKTPQSMIDAGEKHPYIFGGKLKNEYELEGLHFHWGDKNNRGSEHVLNDIRYPMEMHIIHRNKKYKSVAEAIKYGDGLTVLGFFYQVEYTF